MASIIQQQHESVVGRIASSSANQMSRLYEVNPFTTASKTGKHKGNCMKIN